MSCPLCNLAVSTELYHDDDEVIIVRDLNPRGCLYRVLAVWKEHIPLSQLTKEQRMDLNVKLARVMETLRCEGRASNWQFDAEKMTVPGHAHIQAEVTA